MSTHLYNDNITCLAYPAYIYIYIYIYIYRAHRLSNPARTHRNKMNVLFLNREARGIK